MKRLLSTLFVFAFGAAMTLTAVAQENKTSTPEDKNPNGTAMSSKESARVSMADKTFIKKAAQGGLAEVELGKLATEKASNEEVKKFGQRMVDDHTKMLDDLKQLAQSKGVELPGSPGMGDKAHELGLRSKSGKDFDKEYMSEMVKDHEKDVKETADLAQKVKDPELKSAIEKAHGKIQQHLAMAKQVTSAAAR